MSSVGTRAKADQLGAAMSRAVGAEPVPGNSVRHFADSPLALEAMIESIKAAQHRVHLENYIIRSDGTGRRFAEAMIERASAGVEVRVLYDALGSISTSRRYWTQLRQAGVELRVFHPLLTARPVHLLSRNHRKLLVVDGDTAMLGGVCIGDEWAGDIARDRLPWRDTLVALRGPATAGLEETFARTWAKTGPPLKLKGPASNGTEYGDVPVRIVEGLPGRTRIFRAAQLAYDLAVERIWIWDAYLAAPLPLTTALLDAARGGVDVRVLVPSTSDNPLVRDITRVGYRELLSAGVRVFEWKGPMLHAKAMVVDRRWSRVGSSNLNMFSLYANHEIDLLIESEAFNEEIAAQFLKDIEQSTEVVLKPGRIRSNVVQSADAHRGQVHRRTQRERRVAAVVTLGRLAGGVRRRFAAAAAIVFAIIGLLLLVSRGMSILLAGVCFTVALSSLRSALRSWAGSREVRRKAAAAKA